ncbi:thioesterase II family protein [Pseudomonas frederiksbergensis]|nr:alpha/beta fold hydrolase [Pseudomonas frederiksbergensis]
MTNMYSYPHAGGSTLNYKAFKHQFPESIGKVVPIEIPGRGKRGTEPFSNTIHECIEDSIDQIPNEESDYILHGHCMGALLAFETLKALKRKKRKLPTLLVVSGRNAPGYQTDWGLRVAGLDDEKLFEELKSVGGAPRGLSFAMAQQFLTIIRKDQKIVHQYSPDDEKVDVPILVLAGKDDVMTNTEALLQWQDFTSSKVELNFMDGEHYFIYDQAEAVANLINEFKE